MLQSTMNKSLFFARKFDPTVSQAVINNIQERLYGRYVDGKSHFKILMILF